MEENKQIVAEWKQENRERLTEIKTVNPELYSAINMALSFLNKTLTGEELPIEVEVEETIVEPQEQIELRVLDVASIYQLSDFYNTRIHVRNKQESDKFQELIFALGGAWYAGGATVSSSYTPYLFVDEFGRITNSMDSDWFENKSDKKEIFYDDIFKVVKSPIQSHSSKKPSRTTSEKSEWRLKTKEELESEYGIDFDRYGIEKSEISQWYGKNLAEIYTSYKYADVKEAEDSLLITDDIELGDSGLSLPNKYFTKEVSTPLQTVSYKLPIDTYPVTLKNEYSFFEANDGSRKSPTQSAGDLKRMFLNLPGNELSEILSEILNTKFRGNDNKWYELNVGKGGVWTWKKLNDFENHDTQVKFIEETNKKESVSTNKPSSTYIENQKSQFSYSDLVGRQLNWNGNVYEIVKLKKTNPKTIVYGFKNSAGGVETVAVPKQTIEALLLETRLVKGIKLLPKQEETKKYDYTTMSERDLRSLIKDTQDARNEFEVDDPEYEELTTQISLMIDEMKRRGIL